MGTATESRLGTTADHYSWNFEVCGVVISELQMKHTPLLREHFIVSRKQLVKFGHIAVMQNIIL